MSVKGTPPVKWINRVHEYWRWRVGRQGTECAEAELQQGRLETLMGQRYRERQYIKIAYLCNIKTSCMQKVIQQM